MKTKKIFFKEGAHGQKRRGVNSGGSVTSMEADSYTRLAVDWDRQVVWVEQDSEDECYFVPFSSLSRIQGRQEDAGAKRRPGRPRATEVTASE